MQDRRCEPVPDYAPSVSHEDEADLVRHRECRTDRVPHALKVCLIAASAGRVGLAPVQETLQALEGGVYSGSVDLVIVVGSGAVVADEKVKTPSVGRMRVSTDLYPLRMVMRRLGVFGIPVRP